MSNTASTGKSLLHNSAAATPWRVIHDLVVELLLHVVPLLRLRDVRVSCSVVHHRSWPPQVHVVRPDTGLTLNNFPPGVQTDDAFLLGPDALNSSKLLAWYLVLTYHRSGINHAVVFRLHALDPRAIVRSRHCPHIDRALLLRPNTRHPWRVKMTYRSDTL